MKKGRRFYVREVSSGGRVTYREVGTEFDLGMVVWPHGHYLVVIEPGGTEMRPVNPAYVSFVAAARKAEDAMKRVLVKSLEGRPAKTPHTEREIRAWKAFENAGGELPVKFSSSSINDAVEAGMEEIRKAWDLPEQYLPVDEGVDV